MRIRRYLGHDCDSVMGFNNGYYIDDDYIEVKDHAEAMAKCLESLKDGYIFKDDENLERQDNGYELTTGYFNDDGDDITRAEFLELNENTGVGSWRYVYVTYEEGNSNE